MNFFKLHVGDYESATTHLSWDEDAAYNRLMRAYYRRELPIPHVDRYRLIRAISKAQRGACDRVLVEFFVKVGEVWRNKRCDEEIMAYQAQAETNRRIATNRPRTVRDPSDGSYHDSSTKGPPNHKPLTTNQKPEVLSKASAYAEVPTRAVESLRAFLEKQHLNFDDTWLEAWKGHSLERITKAIAIAKGRLQGEELRAGYLDKVLGDEKNFNVNGHDSGQWFDSAAGITAKGRELGIEQRADEHFPDFKARVFTAARKEGESGDNPPIAPAP